MKRAKCSFRQINGTLVTIAKDVKIQVEFNPAQVASYRLIGYEKRILRKEDFNNDKIDAGEIGAGHTVTALYEVVPAGGEAESGGERAAGRSAEVSGRSGGGRDVVRQVRFAGVADGEVALQGAGRRDEQAARAAVRRSAARDLRSAAPDLKFAAAVAEFGMILRDSEFKGNGTLGAVAEWAQEGKGADANGYRAGFLELVRKTEALQARM